LLPSIIAQVGNHANNIQGDVRNVSVNNGQGGCLYKEFLACNRKDYDGKGGAMAYTCWTEKMESVQDMSGFGMTREDFKVLMREELCPNNEMQKLETKFWCHAMVRAGHAAYTDRFHKLARLVPHLVTPKNKRIERVLTDEAIRNGSLNKNTKKRVNCGEPSRDGNFKDDNKRSRTERAFATTTNPIRKEAGPRMMNPLKIAACGACFECGGTDHYKAVCPRLNQAPRQGGNRPNQAMAIEGGQGRGNNSNPTQIEGHTFDIDLIPFGHGSFDVIVMDWLSRHKAEIVCHEKVVKISLPYGEMLRVLGERTEGEVFPDYLSRLPAPREIEFRINLIPRAMLVAKSPYRLAPSEMKELSSQLRELQDKGFIRPSSSP
ncbi:hypothetical protein Tco_1047842, partial [Tanacetum coccineum]